MTFKMRTFRIFCIYLVLCMCERLVKCSVAKRYNLTTGSNKDFSITVGDIEIFHHTAKAPIVYVGTGQIDFREIRGNFFINNYEQDRIGLSQFTSVSRTNSSDTVLFQFGNTVGLNLTFETTETHPLVVTFGYIDPLFNGIWLRVVATAEEKVYGLGEQYSYLNLRGRSYPIWTREQGVGRNKSDIVTFFADNLYGAGGDYHTTYFPQTTFVSSRNFYCHYGGSNYAEVNLLPQNFHEIYINGKPDKFYFNTGSDLKQVVTSLASYLGLQPELPDWVYTGAALGVQGGTDVMMSRLNKALQNNVSVSAMWIQDWAGVLKTSFGSRLFWDWKWNKQLYPDLDKKIKTLKDQGVRVLAYINPNLNIDGDLYKEGAPLDVFIKNSSGLPYITDFGEFFCATVDLTSHVGRNWYKGKIQTNMVDLGLSGWMADFGEYLPADGAFFYSNQSGRDVHNQWPTLWAEVNRMAIDERNATGDVVFWMRAGSAGTGKYTTLMWAGDQNVDFSYGDGLPSTIPAALNMGMSGIGITHFDIGGYTTAAQFQTLGKALVRNEELLLRSAEAAIFTPMFRSHEGNQPQANVQFYSSDYIEQQFGRLSQIFVYISNYTKHVVQENAQHGVPAQRPLFMEFPNDALSWTISYQYLFGPDVLVAPVIQPNVTSMKVYLPPGNWKFLWDNADRTGGQFVSVMSPMGKPPAFYKKESSFAPMFSRIQTQFPVIPKPPPHPTPKPTTSGSSPVIVG